MKRRDILKYTAIATGAAVFAPISLSLVSCKPDQLKSSTDFVPSFFSDEQLKFVKTFVDTILPKSDSPAASEVGVHQIIDNMVGQVYFDEDQKTFSSQFNLVSDHLNKEANFEELDSKKQADLVTSLETTTAPELKTAYQMMKQQTIAYYLSTEEIGLKFLNYLPVPGPYQGCIELSEVGGKKWAI